MIELTDADEVRFGPGSASLEDAGTLAGWLADRGVEALFRVEEGRFKIALLRDLVTEATEPTEPPRLFYAMVEDSRVTGGFRRVEHTTYTATELADAVEELTAKGRKVRFEPVEASTDG